MLSLAAFRKYTLMNDDVGAPFIIEFYWDPSTWDYDISDFISTYRFDN